MKARLATVADSAAIARIYNYGLAERMATFETTPRTPAEIERWFDERHPIVVVEETGAVVAFASTSTYRARACYAGIAEFSVYVAAEARGRGAGHLAMETLLQEAERRGFWKLVSRIFVENTASRSLMKRLGFREVGVYEKHAQLEGVWRDVVIVEYLILTNVNATA